MEVGMKLYRKPILGGAVSAYKAVGEGKPVPVNRRAKHVQGSDEERRQSANLPGLEVLPDRHLAAGEVSDVALGVGADEVLRADVEEGKRALQVEDVASSVELKEHVQLEHRFEKVD